MMGYGQRGLNYEYGISWPRDCFNTKYCWEVTSTDIQLMQKYFDFPWDSYYSTYYITGCGGEWGSPIISPYVLVPAHTLTNGKTVSTIYLPKALRSTIRLNITVPPTITTAGAKASLPMTYACAADYCSSGSTVNANVYLSCFAAVTSMIVYSLVV